MLLNHMLKQPSCYCIQPFVIPWTAACDFPVLHHLPEFVQIHVHWVGDAFQPFHSLLFPSPPASDLSQHQGLSLSLSLFFFLPRVFSKESALHIMWPKYWSFSFSISPSNEYSWLILKGCCWITKHARILGLPSRGEEFNQGPEVRLGCSEFLCNKV